MMAARQGGAGQSADFPPDLPPASGRASSTVEHGGRIKVLDGWRAVAASFVVFAHAINYRFADIPGSLFHRAQQVSAPMAEIGVQLFFVISGFIITSLLLKERARDNDISIVRFYIRRTCRIIPPLLAYYAFLGIMVWAGKITLPLTSLASSASFTCNVGIVDCDWWVAHTWSLAVEEQFYLVWPLLFSLTGLGVQPKMLGAIVGLCGLGVIWQEPTFHSNFTSFGCIAAGALYATFPPFREACARYAHPIIWVLVAAIIFLLPLLSATRLLTPLLPVLVTYFIFAGQSLRPVQLILESRPLQTIGLGSYSLYIWQQFFLAKTIRYADAPPSLWLLPVAVVLSVVLFEKPFITLGRRLSARHHARG